MGGWSGGDEALPSLGLPVFSSGGTMMSMPQAAPTAYPGLQGLWGPVTQPPPTGEPSFLTKAMCSSSEMVDCLWKVMLSIGMVWCGPLPALTWVSRGMMSLKDMLRSCW